MQTRQPNLEGAGEIPLPRRVKEALRMRPSRILVEAHDEWQVSDRRYLSEASMAQLAKHSESAEEVAQPTLIAS